LLWKRLQLHRLEVERLPAAGGGEGEGNRDSAGDERSSPPRPPRFRSASSAGPRCVAAAFRHEI
jgi:hypothetical protein